jgi:glycosyltransferase involved in cell wall biosynthesis
MIFHQPFSAFGVLLARGSRVIPKVCMFLSPWAEEYAARWPLKSRRSKFWSGGRLLRRTVERLVLSASHRIFVLSRFMAARLRAEHPRLNGQVALLPGGVDLDRFRPAENRVALKAALGLPSGSPVLLTVRNLEPRMGIDLLLHATKKVVESVKDVVLIIGGEGPMGEPLRELAGRLGLGAVVRFAGYIPEERLPLFYQAADFFVLPSKQLEGFGLVAVEALACGTPVLGTPVGAIPEILERLSPGLLFEGTDPEAIAESMEAHIGRLRADPHGYEALRRRCRAYAETRFGWARVIDRLEHELFRLVGPSRGQV